MGAALNVQRVNERREYLGHPPLAFEHLTVGCLFCEWTDHGSAVTTLPAQHDHRKHAHGLSPSTLVRRNGLKGFQHNTVDPDDP